MDMSGKKDSRRFPNLLFVLGAPNDADGRLSSLARGRCDRAISLWRDNPDWDIVLTGGFGEHFNTTVHPHATYLKRRMIGAGVPENRIVALVESRNTREDAALSRPLVLEGKTRFAVVVTSDFHVERARFLFRRAFSDVEVGFFFVGVETDESDSELDLTALRAHENAVMAEMNREL